jgi:hypothetical protein
MDPLDLINLSRVNKEFRATFMSRSARFVWTRVLEGVPGLPGCPLDMTEPQYASLIFEQHCLVLFSYVFFAPVLFTDPPVSATRHATVFALRRFIFPCAYDFARLALVQSNVFASLLCSRMLTRLIHQSQAGSEYPSSSSLAIQRKSISIAT